MNRRSIVGLIGLATALVAAGPIGTFAAAKPGNVAGAKKLYLVRGSVTAVAKSSITVTTTDKKLDSPVMVAFNTTTQYYVDGKLAIAAPTFAVGEKVLLSGTKQADGSLIARSVAVGDFSTLPGGKKGNGGANGKNAAKVNVAGTLTAASATSLTVTLADGTSQTIALDAKTQIMVNGQPGTGTTQLKPGDKVRVVATKQEDGSLLALSVAQGAAPKPANEVRVVGTVAAITATGITVTTPSGAVIVKFGSSTSFVVDGKKSATVPQVTPGAKVTIVSQKQTDGSLVAVRVSLGKAATSSKTMALKGTASLSGTTLTVTAKDGTKTTVQIGPKTKFVVDGKVVTSLPTLTAKQMVSVAVTKNADGSLLATRITVEAARAKAVHVIGTVKSSSAASIAILSADGTITPVKIDAKTKIRVNGKVVTSLPTLDSTTKVTVAAAQQPDGTLVARTITIKMKSK